MTKHKPYGPYEKYIKRPQDFLCALLATIVLSPVLLIVAVLVRVKLGSPVLFTQKRPGKDGKIFKLYKFRTMLPPKDGVIDPAQDAARLTPFGRKLRSTSLDGRVIIGQTTESLENKGFREVSPIHFHMGHNLFSTIADHADIEGILCQKCLKTEGFRHFLVPEFKFSSKGQTFG